MKRKSQLARAALVSWLLIIGVCFAATDDPEKTATPQTNSSASQPPNASSPDSSKSNPCPASSDSNSSKPFDCAPAANGKHKKRRPPVQNDEPDSSGPTKTVIRNGGLTDAVISISPSLTGQQAAEKQRSTNQLLAATDANLKTISSHQLTPVDQDTLRQIKSYVEQSKVASNDGDLERAYNLANKAKLLSTDLAGTAR